MVQCSIIVLTSQGSFSGEWESTIFLMSSSHSVDITGSHLMKSPTKTMHSHLFPYLREIKWRFHYNVESILWRNMSLCLYKQNDNMVGGSGCYHHYKHSTVVGQSLFRKSLCCLRENSRKGKTLKCHYCNNQINVNDITRSIDNKHWKEEWLEISSLVAVKNHKCPTISHLNVIANIFCPWSRWHLKTDFPDDTKFLIKKLTRPCFTT